MLRTRFLVALVAVALISAATGSAFATDYKLELVGKPIRNGELVDFSVRLVRADTLASVLDATLHFDDFNMEPEGMTGSTTVYSLPSNQAGIFSLRVQPVMGGRWALEVTADVPGERASVKDTLVVPVPE